MRVSAESLMVLAIVLATASFAIMGALFMARRRRDVELREHGSPLLVLPPSANAGLLDPHYGSAAVESPRPRRSPRQQQAVEEQPRGDLLVVQTAQASIAVNDPLTVTTNRFVTGQPVPEVVQGHTLRFHRPTEGTVEFLPGFLEVIGGPDAGHELRFVKPSDGADAVITFGRKEGAAYTHVQLLEPTVSRSHARLRHEGDRWRLFNLSRTNPVIVNRNPLDGVEASQLLGDADVIEMGALVFRFHAR